jgi:predicted nucleic acid-binding protein
LPRSSAHCRASNAPPDPTDDFLLALSEAGKADYLVTGDKSGPLALGRPKATRILSASDFAAMFA